MPDQQNGSTPGEAQNTSADGGTPNAPGSEAAPTSAPSTPDLKTIRNEGFNDGYGVGGEKGAQREAERWVGLLSEYGISGGSYDEVREALESRQGAPRGGQEPANVEESEQYQNLARDHVAATNKLKKLEDKLAQAELRADQARLDKFARAAVKAGISKDALEYFVPKHQGRIRMTEAGDLIVLSKMEDGTLVPAGEKLEDYLKGVVEMSPFLQAPQGGNGAGSSVSSVSDPARIPRGNAPANYDTRSFAERLKDSRR
jgi:hypothetical protein